MYNFDKVMQAYGVFVDTTVVLSDDTKRERLLLGALGLSTEASEAADVLKKHTLHGKPLDMDKLVDELGDTIWHITLLSHTLDLKWSDILDKNIGKLKARHLSGKPDFYTGEEDMNASTHEDFGDQNV